MEPITLNSPSPPTPGRPWRSLVAAAALVAVAFGVLVSGSLLWPGEDSATTTVPSLVDRDATVATVDAFVAAFNSFDRRAFIGMLDSDPTVLQWPSSLGPYEVSITDLGWFEFQEKLEGRVTLTGCRARQPGAAGSDLYDAIIGCDAAITNRLFMALDGDAISGRLEFGVNDERIESIFWNETGHSAASAVADLRIWMAQYQPHLAAHWLGGSSGSPLYGAELAEVFLNAADERSRSGGGPPSVEETERIHPGPTSGNQITADHDGERVFLIAGRDSPFIDPSVRPVWEFSSDGIWRRLTDPGVPLLAATVIYAADLNSVVVVGVTDPGDPSLLTLTFDLTNESWEEGSKLALIWPELSRFHFPLSSAYDDTSNRIVAIGRPTGWWYPPALWLYDVSAGGWRDEADPWAADPETDDEPQPCAPRPVPQDLSVAFDPKTDRFIIAAGSELCGYNPDTATIELIARDYGPMDSRAIVRDPVSGLLFIIGDARLWSYQPATGVISEAGSLPAELLWRNAEMAAQPRAKRIVVFDGADLWSYHPANGSWSNPDRPTN